MQKVLVERENDLRTGEWARENSAELTHNYVHNLREFARARNVSCQVTRATQQIPFKCTNPHIFYNIEFVATNSLREPASRLNSTQHNSTPRA